VRGELLAAEIRERNDDRNVAPPLVVTSDEKHDTGGEKAERAHAGSGREPGHSCNRSTRRRGGKADADEDVTVHVTAVSARSTAVLH
jgi:hypothetical protein